ncbi:MAG: hypothetical protein FWH18_08440 [Marinilabiliaceae bacterium]|nr:hypothetical protein [Marinilabiliaceae bacterium]
METFLQKACLVILLIGITFSGCLEIIEPSDSESYDLKSFVCEGSNEIIIGKIGHRAQPCPPEMACPGIDVVAIRNDTATFVLIKEEKIVYNCEKLGNYSEGDMISILGCFTKGECQYDDDFYYLVISEILE